MAPRRRTVLASPARSSRFSTTAGDLARPRRWLSSAPAARADRPVVAHPIVSATGRGPVRGGALRHGGPGRRPRATALPRPPAPGAGSDERDDAVVVSAAAVDHARAPGGLVGEEEEVVADELHVRERVVDGH